ncbi:Os10g0410650, partial [Oryza sativa Japonica Group]
TDNLKEIIRCSPCHIWFTSPRSWFKLQECVIPAVINLQDGCHVATAITIIRCTEYGHDLLFLCVLYPSITN